MTIRLPRRYVHVVQDLALFNKVVRHCDGELLEEPRYHVTPRLLRQMQVERLRRELGCLLRSETRPFVLLIGLCRPGVIKVSLRLREPVIRAICHAAIMARIARRLNADDLIGTSCR